MKDERSQLWQDMLLVLFVALLVAACAPIIQVTPIPGLTTPTSQQDQPTSKSTEPTLAPVLPTPFYTPKEIVDQLPGA